MKRILKNIKTTIFGAVAGLPQIVDGLAHRDISQIIVGISTLAVGLFAKDADHEQTEGK